MKKILIVSIIVLSFLTVGCGNSIDKLSNNEYVEKLTTTLENTIAAAYSEGINFKNDEYSEKYEDNDVANKERFKDFIDDITNFKADDEKLNNFNNKIIEASKEVYNMLDEVVNLKKYSEEYNQLTEKIFSKKEEIASLIKQLYENLDIKINNK